MWLNLTSFWITWLREICVIENNTTFAFFCDYWASTQFPTIAIPHHSAVSSRATEPTTTILDFFYCSEIVLLRLFPEWNSTFTRVYVWFCSTATSSTLTHGLWVITVCFCFCCLSDFSPNFFLSLVSLLHWCGILNEPLISVEDILTFAHRGNHWISISFSLVTSIFDWLASIVVLHSTSQRLLVKQNVYWQDFFFGLFLIL